MKDGEVMTFIFKCGECNHSYTVDTERVETMTFGNYCPNCEAFVPQNLKEYARKIALMKSNDFKGWQVQAYSDEAIELKSLI